MPPTTNKPNKVNDLESGASDEPHLETLPPVQFPISVFFQLSGLVALICMFSAVTGWLSALCLAAMAFAILFRLGIASLVCFAVALFTVQTNTFWPGIIACVGLGCLIASWPLIHAAIFQSRNGSSKSLHP